MSNLNVEQFQNPFAVVAASFDSLAKNIEAMAPTLRPSIQTPRRISRSVSLMLTPYTFGLDVAKGMAEMADAYVAATKEGFSGQVQRPVKKPN